MWATLVLLFGVSFLLAIAISQCFERYVHSDLVTEFEAVGNCLCRIENAYFQTVDPFLLYTKDKRLAREADNPDGRRIDLWSPSFYVDCNPNFMGNLRSDLVELQRRQ